MSYRVPGSRAPIAMIGSLPAPNAKLSNQAAAGLAPGEQEPTNRAFPV
jgi:hypothetical protein